MVALCSGKKNEEQGTAEFSIWMGILLSYPTF